MSLEAQVERLKALLPGWWWRAGECSVSAEATIGPDRSGPDAHLLRVRLFDDGIDVDIPQPATAAEALSAAIDLARAEKAKHPAS